MNCHPLIRLASIFFFIAPTLLYAETTTSPSSQPAAASATQSAPKELPRAFTTMQAILDKVPQELRPQPNPEWYKYTEGKFFDWTDQEISGMNFSADMKFGSCTVMGGISGKDKWLLISGTFAPRVFSYFGTAQEWNVRLPSQVLDETEAKKWDALKKGTILHVTGIISGIHIERIDTARDRLPRYRYLIELAGEEIAPLK